MVPAELMLSPQLMVAVKSPELPVALLSLNLAVTPLNICVLTGGAVLAGVVVVAGVGHIDVSAASPTLAVEMASAVFELSLSVTCTVTGQPRRSSPHAVRA